MAAESASSGGQSRFLFSASRSHGNSGVVKSKFTSNLPAKIFGASCRIVGLLCLRFDKPCPTCGRSVARTTDALCYRCFSPLPSRRHAATTIYLSGSRLGTTMM